MIVLHILVHSLQFTTHHLANEILLRRERENSSIGRRHSKVSILQRITCISTSETSSIRTELLDSIIHSKEVTSTLRHLLIVQLDMTITEVTARHLRHRRPDSLVVVKTHHQMVLDQVLTTHTDIEGVPVVELVTELCKLLLGDGATLRILLLHKIMIEYMNIIIIIEFHHHHY